MTPAPKSVVARDVEQARRDVDEASISVKQARARFGQLSKIDKDLLARSRGQLGKLRVRLKQKQGNSLRPDPIDRMMLERHLQQAERHVAVGEEQVSRQRERVAQLERDGYETSNATRLLTLFEELQATHIAHRHRLARQLTGDVR